jgi:ABC-type multidrug transport system fused ATPase/permease subunit
MLQTIPKVLFELAIVLGVIGYFFLSKLLSTPASETLPSLILLFAVAARLTPGLLRMQTALLVIKSNSGLSDEVLALHQELKSDSKWPPEKIHYDGTSQEFVPDLVLKDLTFRYIANQPLIDNINLEVKCGERIAIIGETGAGKSTLLKLLLGLKEPISGSVKISNVDAKQIHKLWPNSIAYIPQEVTVFDGSLLQNVTLNFDLNNYSSNKLIGEILSKVGLDKFLRNFESTTDVILGTNGVILSGGEKQKLGLARALFAKSKILILDEPTASLDQQSKLEFVNIINLLSKEMTVVIVTHENVLNYQLDKIYELRNGIIEVSHHNS